MKKKIYVSVHYDMFVPVTVEVECDENGNYDETAVLEEAEEIAGTVSLNDAECVDVKSCVTDEEIIEK